MSTRSVEKVLFLITFPSTFISWCVSNFSIHIHLLELNISRRSRQPAYYVFTVEVAHAVTVQVDVQVLGLHVAVTVSVIVSVHTFETVLAG